MKCPHCGKDKNNVYESRKKDSEVWRRRLCQICLKTFVTQETTSKTLKFPKELNGVARQTQARLKPPKAANENAGRLNGPWGTTAGTSTKR